MLLNNTLELLLMASCATTRATTTTMKNIQPTQTIYETVNSTFVINIVGRLQQNIDFKNFVFYVSQSLYHDSEEAALFINAFWHRFPMIPGMVITDNSRKMSGLLDMPTLCFVLTTTWNDSVLKILAKSLDGLRYFKIIFLYFPLANTNSTLSESSQSFKEFDEEVQFLYNWVWERRFLNTVLITINNNVFVYDGYPTGIVINKTGDWEVKDFFRKEKLNLKGWEIKTPVRNDVPRVFSMRRFPQRKRGSILSGSSGKLFGAFINYINGSFNESTIAAHEFEPFQTKELLKLVESDQLEIEISVHSYTARHNVSVDTSYPVGINDWCLMVPFRNSSSENMFLRRSFQPSGWLLLGFAGCYITVGIWLCTPLPERDMSISFLQTICSLLLIPPQKILILPYRRLRFMFILLFVIGFCLTNMFLTKMATHLTASPDEKQINTIQDVIAAKLPIMVSFSDQNMLSSLNLPAEFKRLLLPVHERLMSKHRESLNTSYGYTISSDRWEFINRQQEFLKKPLFHRTKICIGPFYHVFPLQTNSDLTQPFKEFILDVQQSGLISFWESEAFSDALFLGYVHILGSSDEFTPLSINFFIPILYVWSFGLTLSAVTFLWESKRVAIAQVRRMSKKWR